MQDQLYFADVSNRRVRAIDLTTGIITTVAGGGAADIGDGGPATAATFSTHPMRVMVHGEGDLYITDAHQNKVRKVDATTGVIERKVTREALAVVEPTPQQNIDGNMGKVSGSGQQMQVTKNEFSNKC